MMYVIIVYGYIREHDLQSHLHEQLSSHLHEPPWHPAPHPHPPATNGRKQRDEVDSRAQCTEVDLLLH